MLWFMRRPWVKAARRNIPNFAQPAKREKVWNRIKTQDAWAMKHGLFILTIIMNLVIGYVFMVATYLAILKWQELHPGPIFSTNQVP